jgi:hypothetical protein
MTYESIHYALDADVARIIERRPIESARLLEEGMASTAAGSDVNWRGRQRLMVA